MAEYTKQRQSRYERKFVTDAHTARSAEHVIKMHPSFFTEIYTERLINNIYFDTPDLSFYFDNTRGKSQRTKFRIRWYGDLFTKVMKPVLEIKIKSGQVGKKRQFDLLPFEFTEFNFDTAVLYESLRNSEMDEDIRAEVLCLRPTLVNRYTRTYFTDITRNFRTTVDCNVNYFNIAKGVNDIRNQRLDNRNVIVELKYDFEHDNVSQAITRGFPFRLTKNSKYVNGIEEFNEIPL